jgi:hypothetical protein
MELGVLIPITAIVLGPTAWVANTWIRARHGYPLEDNDGKPTVVSGGGPDAQRTIQLLTNENERQAGQISRLEERIAVLERIATDPAERVSREIDALR